MTYMHMRSDTVIGTTTLIPPLGIRIANIVVTTTTKGKDICSRTHTPPFALLAPLISINFARIINYNHTRTQQRTIHIRYVLVVIKYDKFWETKFFFYLRSPATDAGSHTTDLRSVSISMPFGRMYSRVQCMRWDSTMYRWKRWNSRGCIFFFF